MFDITWYTQQKHPFPASPPPHLLDLLRLQLDRLIIHKDTLALVRLRHAPLPNLRREAIHNLLLNPLEQYPRRLRRARLDLPRYPELDRVRVAYFQRDELLAGVFGLFRAGAGFDGGTVADADEAQDCAVAFGDAEDVVLEVGADGAFLEGGAGVYALVYKVLRSSVWVGDGGKGRFLPHISLCLLSSRSVTFNVALRASSSCSIFRYAGTVMLSSPRGPFIDTVGEAPPSRRSERGTVVVRVLLRGRVMVNVTSGGIERGVRPIWEGRVGVVLKGCSRAEVVVDEDLSVCRRRRQWRGCSRSIFGVAC